MVTVLNTRSIGRLGLGFVGRAAPTKGACMCFLSAGASRVLGYSILSHLTPNTWQPGCAWPARAREGRAEALPGTAASCSDSSCRHTRPALASWFPGSIGSGSAAGAPGAAPRPGTSAVAARWSWSNAMMRSAKYLRTPSHARVGWRPTAAGLGGGRPLAPLRVQIRGMRLSHTAIQSPARALGDRNPA
jgi:hypothetical protein